MSKQEQDLLDYIDKHLLPKNKKFVFNELYNGAYIQLRDAGYGYNFLKIEWQKKNISNRDGWSSHNSNDPQYSCTGILLGEILIGTKKIDNNLYTWVQLERYSTTIYQMPYHLFAYMQYVCLNKNIGPFGKSRYTESNPLVIQCLDLESNNNDLQLLMHEKYYDNKNENRKEKKSNFCTRAITGMFKLFCCKQRKNSNIYRNNHAPEDTPFTPQASRC